PPISLPPPRAVLVPAIGVDAPLVPVGLDPDGSMELPDVGFAGWYRLGPVPGEPGPAVIAAHVDSYDGPDVFYRLHQLVPGDEVHVVGDDGRQTAFVVRDVEWTPKDALPADRIWALGAAPTLRLITCGGAFDQGARTYLENVTVYADLVPATPESGSDHQPPRRQAEGSRP
ncbi:MAG TPA: class F sortase, partial [Egibacteraceae bacterium]|nr:class F sortase [Egibacteraceae bacterium]